MNFSQEVAIVGIGGIFPGAPDLDTLWTNIVGGVCSAREVPRGRWALPINDVYSSSGVEPDRAYSYRGCFVDEFSITDLINLKEIKLDPSYVENLDPLVHATLAAGVSAFNDAVTERVDRKRTGIIIGNIALPTENSSAFSWEILGRSFEEKVLGNRSQDQRYKTEPLNRYVTGLPAGILAKALGLGGGTYTIDAACASSLYAVKLAADELLSGRADMMLSGGVSRPDCLYTQMGFSQLHALSPDGICSPFDTRHNGIVVGEGAGIVVLKRLDDALRSGDHIYALIKGVGLSNDTDGALLAPSSEGQLRCMTAAYKKAGWSPKDIDVIECHATGTPVGDTVEFESLKKLWGDEGWKKGQCIIGSVKSNIGHLLTAAGAAGLIKMLLALKEKTFPPTANFESPAPELSLDDSPFRVLTEAYPWKRTNDRISRKAAVSAFGFGGINAHLLVEEWAPGKKMEMWQVSIEPAQEEEKHVAIVGMDAHFGPWTSLQAFWQRILEEKSKQGPTAKKSWFGVEETGWFREKWPGDIPFKGFGVDKIDIPLRNFHIPPAELKEMLPQQLLMLKVAAGALANAGGKGNDHLNSGVFIGIGHDLNTGNFHVRWSILNKVKAWAKQLSLDLSEEELENWALALRNAAGPALNANRTMGALGSIVASRIAREFKFGGPSFTFSSEESSGLSALEAAVRNLQQGEMDLVLVGAVDLAADIRALIGAHDARPYSASGTARPFDADADGTIFGEGAAAVVLKRLKDAQRNGDRIYAVIEGIGVASGGRPDSVVPDTKTYKAALKRAYKDAAINPDHIDYIETHGSGLQEEDRMEAKALNEFFTLGQREKNCALGSVKADIGHTGAACGLASLVKVCLCLHHEFLLPMRNIKQPRTELTENNVFYLPRHGQYWVRNRAEGPRKAALSSFSVDGNCIHVVLKACGSGKQVCAPEHSTKPVSPIDRGIFAVYGVNVSELVEGLERLRSLAVKFPDDEIDALARKWHRQNPASLRKKAVAVVAQNRDNLLMQIKVAARSLRENPNRSLLLESNSEGTFYCSHPGGPEGKVGFVFPGDGNHYPEMGRQIGFLWSEILRKQDAENDYLRGQVLPEHFWNQGSPLKLNTNHRVRIIGQVVLGTIVSDLLRSFKVHPDAVIGYSLGETTGLFALRAWKDRNLMLRKMNDATLFTEDLGGALRAAKRFWRLPEESTVRWSVGVLDVPAQIVKKSLKKIKRVYLLIKNTPQECVVGGESQAVSKLVNNLDCNFFPINGATIAHCEVVKEVEKRYRDFHVFKTTPPKGVSFYSGAWGKKYELNSNSAADSITAHAINGLDFPRVINAAYHDGVRIFVEIGPGVSCTRMIDQILADVPHMARSACSSMQDEGASVLLLLGQLIAEQVPVSLDFLYGRNDNIMEHKSTPHRGSKTIVIAVGGEPFVVPQQERRNIEQSPDTLSEVKPVWAEVGSARSLDLDQTLATSLEAKPLARVSESGGVSSEAYLNPLISQFKSAETAKARAHEAYLRFSKNVTESISNTIAFQISLLSSPGKTANNLSKPEGLRLIYASDRQQTDQGFRKRLDRDLCMEFAIGSVAKVLGPAFSEVDSYPTRVRLPDEPLMLVDRILSIEGEPKSLKRGGVVTEHDVVPGAWYLDGGRIPTCMVVEAGQADLFLSGYLGIDFKTRGLAVYRLLNADVIFHRSLPGPRDVITYHIQIERFFQQNETYLFYWNFESMVNGEPLLTMKNGCSGFFTPQELASGEGIVHTELDQRPMPGIKHEGWVYPVSMDIESYGDQQIDALRLGDLAGCFGPKFEGFQRPLTIPGGKMKLINRVQYLDPNGGRFGLGVIRAEADIHPDAWFLTCHFVDDHVMPGTLMYECCMHTFRVLLLRLGWVAEEKDAVWEPVPGVASVLKCRGQVIETTRRAAYEISIKELGYRPEPYAIADALMYADGKPIVEITDISIRLSGVTKEKILAPWKSKQGKSGNANKENLKKTAIFDYDRIHAFAVGKPSEAFGEPYKIFDGQSRIIARLPGPPYQFLDRITEIDAEPWKMVAGGTVEAQYDVPDNAWYFTSSRQNQMPFAVLLEIALQPCGWLAAYIGSALTSEIDLSFRNLGGTAVQYEPVPRDAGILTTKVKITEVSSSGGMIVQRYDIEVLRGETQVYKGNTYFGFFSKDALAQQLGIRDAKIYKPPHEEILRGQHCSYPTQPPFPDSTLRMIERIDVFVSDGGPFGLGYIRGSMQVDPDAWFFKAHFYQDPVIPGSLGLESGLQLLKFAAFERWGKEKESTMLTVVPGMRHEWIYRGQVIPANKSVTVDMWVTSIDDRHGIMIADGFLSVDGLNIYQLKDFSLRMEDSES